MHSRKKHISEWKLTQFNHNPFSWHQGFGQFKSSVESATLSDDETFTGLKILLWILANSDSPELTRRELYVEMI